MHITYLVNVVLNTCILVIHGFLFMDMYIRIHVHVHLTCVYNIPVISFMHMDIIYNMNAHQS